MLGWALVFPEVMYKLTITPGFIFLHDEENGKPKWPLDTSTLGSACFSNKSFSEDWGALWDIKEAFLLFQRITGVGRDPQGPQSPTSRSTRNHPKAKSYIREHYPNAPWILAAWCCDQCPGSLFHAHHSLAKNLFFISSLTPSCEVQQQFCIFLVLCLQFWMEYFC